MIFKYLLQNTVPIVNNTVLCTLEFIKRIELLVSVFAINTHTEQRDKRKLSEVIDIFIMLIVVMISQVYMYVS